jgi:predicted glycosyltransferase
MTSTSTNDTPNATAEQLAVKDLAMSVTDPTTGATQEITDLGSCFFGAWGLNPMPWSLFRTTNFALYLYNDGFLNKKLVWKLSLQRL